MKKILFPVIVLFALTFLTSGCADFLKSVKTSWNSSWDRSKSGHSSKATDSSKATKKSGTYLVAVKECNIRIEPNNHSKIVAKARKGVTFKKIGESGKWIHVKMGSGDTGWVFKDLVKEAKKEKSFFRKALNFFR